MSLFGLVVSVEKKNTVSIKKKKKNKEKRDLINNQYLMTGSERKLNFTVTQRTSHKAICYTAKQMDQTGGKQMITFFKNDVSD